MKKAAIPPMTAAAATAPTTAPIIAPVLFLPDDPLSLPKLKVLESENSNDLVKSKDLVKWFELLK